MNFRVLGTSKTCLRIQPGSQVLPSVFAIHLPVFRMVYYIYLFFLVRHLSHTHIQLNFYMDDGFLIWPIQLDINILIGIINQLHPSIKYTVDRGKKTGNKQELNNFTRIKSYRNRYALQRNQ